MAKRRNFIGFSITVAWDMTPIGRHSTSLLRNRRDLRIKCQEVGYSEKLVHVYSILHTSLWHNVQLAGEPVLPYCNQLCSGTETRQQRCSFRETDIPLDAVTFIRVHCVRFLNEPTNDSTYLINVYLSLKDNITCCGISRRDFDEV